MREQREEAEGDGAERKGGGEGAQREQFEGLEGAKCGRRVGKNI